MRVERDYEDLLRLFNKHEVRYCVVGAFAVAFYAIPRYTKDMDIFVEPSLENGRGIVKALVQFGFARMDLTEEDFSRRGRIVQLGYEPVRIDILTSISGVSFKEVWKNRKRAAYGDIEVPFIGIAELVRSKRATGRKQDKLDLEILTQKKRTEDRIRDLKVKR